MNIADAIRNSNAGLRKEYANLLSRFNGSHEATARIDQLRKHLGLSIEQVAADQAVISEVRTLNQTLDCESDDEDILALDSRVEKSVVEYRDWVAAWKIRHEKLLLHASGARGRANDSRARARNANRRLDELAKLHPNLIPSDDGDDRKTAA